MFRKTTYIECLSLTLIFEEKKEQLSKLKTFQEKKNKFKFKVVGRKNFHFVVCFGICFDNITTNIKNLFC